MRVLLTGGGTAGHINPAISIANHIKHRQPSCEILFVGVAGGMEEKLVSAAGFELKTLKLRGIRRGLNPKAVWNNVVAFSRMFKAMHGAKAIIKEFSPDIIIGTGGFASYPIISQGSHLKIPTIIHESNVLPGRTNRRLACIADKTLIGFSETENIFPSKVKPIFTGNPLREGMIFTTKEKAKNALGIKGKLIYSTWGSLGAREMNKITAELFALEVKGHSSFLHIHSTGATGFKWMPGYVRDLGVDLDAQENIDMREYVFNAPNVMAAADLVLCRAGAMTVSELCATGTPSIIIPSPNVADNHQHKNALALSQRGAAVFLEEKDTTAKLLFNMINELIDDEGRLYDMGQAAIAMAVYDANEKIYDIIMEMTNSV